MNLGAPAYVTGSARWMPREPSISGAHRRGREESSALLAQQSKAPILDRPRHEAATIQRVHVARPLLCAARVADPRLAKDEVARSIADLERGIVGPRDLRGHGPLHGDLQARHARVENEASAIA